MIDLNTSQKEQVSVLYKHYGTDTLTRGEINALVKKNKLKNVTTKTKQLFKQP